MSWRVTLACTRAQAEALPEAEEMLAGDNPPVLVADEPDPDRPDDWLIHAYFDHEPDGRRTRRRCAVSAPASRRSKASPKPTG